MRTTMLVKTAAALALFVGMSAAQIKYVAVVETELDAQSGADTKLNRAEVRQITAELRSVAVKNLPRDKYNIMTSETVMSQGSARLEECAEENCVIALGAKIGADYIVRGIISKFGASLTLSVEMYETEDGNLVATSGLVRSENTAELLDKAAAVCAEMYKGFVAHRGAAKAPPLNIITHTVTVSVNPQDGGYVTRTPNKDVYNDGDLLMMTATPNPGFAFIGWSGASSATKPTLTAPVDRDVDITANFRREGEPYREFKPAAQPTARTGAGESKPAAEVGPAPPPRVRTTGITGAFFFKPEPEGHIAYLFGFIHTHPIREKTLAWNVEVNLMYGMAMDYDYRFDFFGVNVPLTALYKFSVFSVEFGVDADLLFGDDNTVFNAGYVAGAGIGFNTKKNAYRFYYRYCGGYNLQTHAVGFSTLY